MINLYAGFDPREEVGFHCFTSSVIERTSIPVSITPLHAPMLGALLPAGSNAFTLTRFLVPWLQGYKGYAIFADGSDMLCQADLAELWACRTTTLQSKS
jgi:hypothetical protein